MSNIIQTTSAFCVICKTIFLHLLEVTAPSLSVPHTDVILIKFIYKLKEYNLCAIRYSYDVIDNVFHLHHRYTFFTAVTMVYFEVQTI